MREKPSEESERRRDLMNKTEGSFPRKKKRERER